MIRFKVHKHILDPQKHKSFIDEQRRDPVTGEIIGAGDTVVFCASCKSAFLHDSWDYIDGKHCGQSYTLASIPEQNSLQVLTKNRRALIINEFSSKAISGRMSFIVGMIFLISILPFLFRGSFVFDDVFYGLLDNIFFMVFPFLHSFKSHNTIRFHEDRVEVRNKSVLRFIFKKKEFRYEDIERVFISRSSLETPSMTFKLRDNERVKITLNSLEVEPIRYTLIKKGVMVEVKGKRLLER